MAIEQIFYRDSEDQYQPLGDIKQDRVAAVAHCIWSHASLNTDTDIRFVLNSSNPQRFACLVRRNGSLRYLLDDTGEIIELDRSTYSAFCSKLANLCDETVRRVHRSFEGILHLRFNLFDQFADITREEKFCDARITLLPSQGYDALHLRLINNQLFERPLSEVIEVDPFRTRLAETLKKISEGLCVICGPAGNGKTTTYYSLLDQYAGLSLTSGASLDEPSGGRVVVSLEDPIEHVRPRLTQVRVNRVPDFSYAEALRETLRHDPNLIGFGEIRDEISARAALMAASTGHLVLATLHCWDSSEVFNRLETLGVNRLDSSSVLRLVINQRLPGRNCPACRIPDDRLDTATLANWAVKEFQTHFIDRHSSAPHRAIHDPECKPCSGAGILGRVPVFDLHHFHPVSKSLPLAEHEVDTPATFTPDAIPMTAYLAALFLKGELSLEETTTLRDSFSK